MAWGGLTTPAYCWYDNSISNAERFGALYNFHVVASTNSLNVCPEGWSVPSEADWLVLTNFLTNNGYGHGGVDTLIGKSLASQFRWTSDGGTGVVGNDLGSNNSSGFSSLPSGYRYNEQEEVAFDDAGFGTYFWSATQDPGDPDLGISLSLIYDQPGFPKYGENKTYGHSVRCIRD